ncbi:MAG: hypothetical protein KBT34_08390 [Prevotella sp.]|nr:hypothetical protein [Candidatus Prevotella equi]
MKTKSNFINCIVMMIVMALSSMGTMAQQTYISDVYILWGGEHFFSSGDELPDGYVKINIDLNNNYGGDYMYLCYKTTTNIYEAICGLIVVHEDGTEYSCDKKKTIRYNGLTYYPASYSPNSGGGDMFKDSSRSGHYWLYYEKVGRGALFCKPSVITDLWLDSDYEKPSEHEHDVDFFYTHRIRVIPEDGRLVNWGILEFNEQPSLTYPTCIAYRESQHVDHKMELQEYTPATCTTSGNNEYYKCQLCNRGYKLDIWGYHECSEQDIVIPALGHDWDKIYDETTGAWQLDCKRCKHNEVRKQMCITANENDVFLNIWCEINPGDDDDWYGGTYELPEVQYSLNGGPWETFIDNDCVRMNQGDMVWLRGNNIYFSRDESNYTWFKISGSASATGNVTSLIDNTGEGTDYPFDHCFYRLFEGSELETSPRLNATRLNENCYEEMFYGCTNLREVTLCATDKSSVESAIGGWLDGTAANGIVHITDELALADANLQLPTGWKADKVGIHANEDPDNAGDYYATFYDSQSEYSVKEGTKAYTGIVDGDVLNMTAEADNIIPAGEGVLLKGNTADVILTLSDTEKEQTPGNALTGSDSNITAPANSYIFTYAQKGLGFYKYAAGKSLAAHKAYLVNASGVKGGFSLSFDGTPTGTVQIENGEWEMENSLPADIYNLQGVRMNRLQKGINIVKGMKMYIK